MPTVDIREDRPPYVTFERTAVEDRTASIKEGRYIAKDVDYAVVTPIGSKDRIPRQVHEWFAMLEQQVRQERFSPKWLQQYREAYDAWTNGQEPPLHGTPIKGWPVLSPAQQANIIGANILTVEDLAQANDEVKRRIGLGAREAVDKAITYLKTASGAGQATEEIAALKVQVAALTAQLELATQRLVQTSQDDSQSTEGTDRPPAAKRSPSKS